MAGPCPDPALLRQDYGDRLLDHRALDLRALLRLDQGSPGISIFLGVLRELLHPQLPPLSLSVNLSHKQFFHPDLFAQVEEALASSGLAPGSLGLEITEGVILAGAQVTDTGLKELATFKNLTRLDLSHTQVTDEGVKELQKALLKCEIVK